MVKKEFLILVMIEIIIKEIRQIDNKKVFKLKLGKGQRKEKNKYLVINNLIKSKNPECILSDLGFFNFYCFTNFPLAIPLILFTS